MVVSIDFFGTQRSLTQTNNIAMPIDEETRVTDALTYVKNQYPELPLDERMVLVTVNEEMASLDRLLQADDTVSFLPYICGG
jgi:molybdopterin converting factor small subunit